MLNTVELEDNSRSRSFLRGYLEVPEEEAKGVTGEQEGEGGALEG